VRILDPESFGISHSIIALGYPIVGGVNSIWGGIIGGAVLRALPESLRSFGQYQELWVAALAIIVMVINPSGILGIAERLFPAGTRAKPDMIARSDVPDVSTSPQRAAFHKYAINVERARKAYDGLVAVNDVTLNVQPGHIHGLIGPNGAGKTTLFNAISGFIPLDFGIISLFGERVDGESSRSRIGHGMTRTFQNVAVFGHLSCLDNVILGVGCNGIGHSVAASMHEACGSRQYRALRDRAIAALSEVGLQCLMDVPANQLSLGNQRRLEIARAVVSRPRLILLDEPVSGVSPEEQAQIAALLLGLNRNHSITMLVIEHDISFVRAVCHSISVMAAGRIIAEGKPESVIRLPEVRRQYFGEFDASAA
jgi:branched-chain amino acid transport system permease protein